MNVKEINKLKNILYNEIVKNKEIKEKLKYNKILYIVEFSEGNKNKILILEKLTHINKNLIKNYNFTENVNINLIYTIDKQRKICE